VPDFYDSLGRLGDHVDGSRLIRFYAHLRRLVSAAVILICVTLYASDAAAQGGSIGGHIGVAVGVASRDRGSTTTMVEDFGISLPMGLILLKNKAVPIDLAVVPTFTGDEVNLSYGVNTAHSIGGGYAIGFGGYIDPGNDAWGLAPALDKLLLQMNSGKALIADLFVPVQFNKDAHGASYVSVSVAVHVGLAF
jgi:hypothetical protein